jgi:hypothetical protein
MKLISGREYTFTESSRPTADLISDRTKEDREVIVGGKRRLPNL